MTAEQPRAGIAGMPDRERWFPVARGADLVARHVMHTQLLGQELALWRDDAGSVNAWENRCPHRGVRLSLGLNTGTELQCQYHGWRYASGSGQCTFIPAHPTQRPASSVRATAFACVEHQGFVWVSLGGTVDSRMPPAPAAPAPLTLRSLFVNASADRVGAALSRRYGVAHSEGDPYRWANGTVGFGLQPVSGSQSVIHGWIAHSGTEPPMTLLRHHNARLTALREEVERAAASEAAWRAGSPDAGPEPLAEGQGTSGIESAAPGHTA